MHDRNDSAAQHTKRHESLLAVVEAPVLERVRHVREHGRDVPEVQAVATQIFAVLEFISLELYCRLYIRAAACQVRP